MKHTILLLLVFLPMVMFSQVFHKAGERLKEPKSYIGYHISPIFFPTYDTIPIMYVLKGERLERVGYKPVLVKNGYYTDDKTTYRVFLNDQKQPIKTVDIYYFK